MFYRRIFLILLLFLSLFGCLVSGQEFTNIAGLIQDVATGKPLPFAQIAWQGTNVGTIANEEGKFILSVPYMLQDDSLLVSYMGYQTGRFSCRTNPGNDLLIIKLQPAVFRLSELEITALQPEEVLRKCVEHIPENYGVDPLILTAFIRSGKYVNGSLAEFTEALIENKKSGYSLYLVKQEKDRRKNSNIPLLIKGRVVSDTLLVNKMEEIGRNAGCLGCNFIHDFAEFYHGTVLDETMFRYYTFSMQELPGEDGKIYEIRFDQKKGVKKKLWHGTIQIKAGDFALVRISQKPSFEAFETYEKGKLREQFFLDHQYGWIKEMPKMEWTTTYSKRKDHYYLNAIFIENWLTFTHLKTGKQIRFYHKNEVVVTDATRDPEKIKSFIGDKSTGAGQRWDQVVGKGDAQFWKNLNYLPMENSLENSVNQLLQ